MIEAQIQYSKIQAVSRQMGENLQRISRSPLVSQDRAFATAIFTGELELAVQHQYEPEHLFAMKEDVEHLFEYFSFDISDGDVLLVADPYSGGTKGQTLTMAAPLFHQGELVLFPVVRVQMIDLAGEFPGGYNPTAFEVWQESMRVTPVKLYKRGLLQRDILRFLLANSRVPSLYEAELQAMYACLRSAQEQILTLLGQHGNQLSHSIDQMNNYSRNRVVDHLNQLPKEAVKSHATFISNGQSLTINVSVKSIGEQVTIDFDGTDEQVETPVNAALSTTKAFAVWPLLAPLAEEVAINKGVLDAFLIKAPKGSLLNPTFPAAVGFSAIITGHLISEAVTIALKESDTPETIYSEIHGAGPQAVLFPPFGKYRETEPIFLVPGYPESKQGFGPSALFGDRKLVSAEELEFNYGFKIIKRETNEDQQMIVRLVNYGADYHVTIVIPESSDQQYGNVSIHSQGKEEIYHRSVAGETLQSGDEIEFVYDRKGGVSES